MRVLPVVMSCVKNKSLWRNILSSHKSCIIFCAKKLETDFLLEDRILYLNCRDTYECLPEKIICMINAILKINIFSDVTHIIKIDDHDTHFSNEMDDKIYKCILDTYDYAGQKIQKGSGNRNYHFGKCSNNSFWNTTSYNGEYTDWADGGSGYILSRRAMLIINNKYSIDDINTIYKTHIFEDVMIALILKHANIFPVKIDKIIESHLISKCNH